MIHARKEEFMIRQPVAVSAVLAAVLLLPALGPAQSNIGGAATDVKNEKAVRAVYDHFVAAWNRHDTAAMGKMYTVDGDHLEPDGNHVDGRDAVELLFQRQHESVFAHSRLMLNIQDVWFITQDVALVDGGYALSGARMPDGKELPERRGHLTAVLLAEGGQWLIAASRLMIPTELPYK
jgi:uncharacterized protein (TIGR02246 family)